MSYLGNPIQSVAFLTNQFSGNGSTVAFTLSVAPATSSSLLVSISGVLQDPSVYSINGTTITFSGAPPAGTGNISVRYLGVPATGIATTAYRTVTEFTATSNQTTFTPPSYTIGYIAVYLNGARLASDDFTASDGVSVVLTVGASVGDSVVTESFYVSSVLNAIPAVSGAINSTYIANNAVITSKIQDANVTTAKIADANITQAKLGANVSSTGPAFNAYISVGSQAISPSTWTKAQLSTEEFDTNSCFDTTNYRFTPNVSGYYLITGILFCSASNYGSINQVAIYKNGSVYKKSLMDFNGGTGGGSPLNVSALNVSAVMYFNGITDYVELYGYSNYTNNATFVGSGYTFLSGSMVRSA